MFSGSIVAVSVRITDFNYFFEYVSSKWKRDL
jgi:hypothetical protein